MEFVKREIDLEQDFLPMYNSDLVETVYRFKVYRATPSLLFQDADIDYYSIVGASTYEVALFGIKWIPDGKNLQIRTRMLLGKSCDEETFELIVEALIDKLTEKKVAELRKCGRMSPASEKKEV
jgi:hypothetical protein